MTYRTRLSKKRITISLITICLIPFIALAINTILQNRTISYMFSINLCGTILIIYDWNLFGIHYNRYKANLGDSILYTVVGLVIFALWFYFNATFFQASTVKPDYEVMNNYLFAKPVILIAYSYMLSIIINIGFKCLTDHLDIRSKELLIILVSGILFGLVYTIVFKDFCFANVNLIELLRNYFFNVIMVSILSYLYNQSSSFLPGTISLGTILLVFQLLSI